MLPKNRRINKQLFQDVLKKGRGFSSKNLSLSYLKDINFTKSRFSFVVSKKIAKKAVDRNLLKRRGYATINNVLKDVKFGFLAIFFLKKGSEKLSFKELQEEIIYLLKKTEILPHPTLPC